MEIQKCTTNKTIELLDSEKVRTDITVSESIATSNRTRVYRNTKHFTEMKEKSHPTKPEYKELYYLLKEDIEIPLNEYRVLAKDEQGKQMILDGLLELFLLVSEGKIYDIEINPFNFIAQDNPELGRVFIKAFYRDSKGRRELTDEWLMNVKKIIGYFLVDDTRFQGENFNESKPSHYLAEMTGHVYDKYLQIIRSTTVDQMAKEWFSLDTYKQLKGFPHIEKEYRKPKDITSVSKSIFNENKIEKWQDEKENNVVEQPKKEEKEREVKTSKKDENKKPHVVPAVYKQRKSKKKTFFFVLFLLLVGAVLGVIMYNYLWSVKSNEIALDENHYNGMIQASVQQYSQAALDFDKVSLEYKKELGEAEVLSIFFTYLMNEEYDKALEVDANGAESVINYLNRQDKIEEVKDIQTPLPAILYEQAVLDNNYEQVIELKEEVTDTEDRQKDIVNAFINLNDLDSAIEYVKAKEMEDGKTLLTELYDTYANKEELSKEERKNAKKEIDNM